VVNSIQIPAAGADARADVAQLRLALADERAGRAAIDQPNALRRSPIN